MVEEAVKAAQPSERKRPDPPGIQHHIWTTVDEYVAQVALPVHLTQGDMKRHPNAEGVDDMRFATLCGLVPGFEENIVRTTDDPAEMTCSKCKRKVTTAKRAKKK